MLRYAQTPNPSNGTTPTGRNSQFNGTTLSDSNRQFKQNNPSNNIGNGQTATIDLDAPPIEYSLDENQLNQPYSDHSGFEECCVG